MECEMCGKTIATRRHDVSGTVMNLGTCCTKYGTPLDAPAPAGSKAAVTQNLEKRATRMTSRNVYEQDTMDLVSDFGARIRKAREAKGWTLEQLGNKVSARVPQLHKIEAGGLRPSDDLTKRFERDLGITLLEKVDAGPAAVGGVKQGASKAGLTIGDLLKDAMDKK